jgi:hypothetical protein
VAPARSIGMLKLVARSTTPAACPARGSTILAACPARIGRTAVVVCSSGLLVALGLVGLDPAPAARAGDYHVYSCRTPWGAPAPVDGWGGSVARGSAADDYDINSCSEGGALIAALGELTIHAADVDMVDWTFEAPAGERLAAATLWRAARLQHQAGEEASYQFWIAGPRESEDFDACVAELDCVEQGNTRMPLSEENRVSAPGGNLGARLYFGVMCGGVPEYYCEGNTGRANEYADVGYLYAADLVLEQNEGPTVTGVTGELATVPSVTGTSDVEFTASDPGSGVYEALFSVDGQVVQRTVVDENGGRCVNVGGTSDGLPAFLYVQPCAAKVSVDVPFDSTQVSNGSHHLVVTVIDAAGNSAPVLDRQLTISNPPPPGTPGPPNGTNASAQATLTAAWTGAKGARLTSAYGRTHVIEGRLTAPGGMPIGDAQIECIALPAYAGAKAASIACPKTESDGRFALRLPGDVGSRTLKFAYHAHLGSSPSVATRSLVLIVRAGLRLRVSPRTTSVGGRIVFTGRLLGGPIPPDGKEVVLEARSPGGPWIEFDVLRSDRRGAYRAFYRFKFPGPASYSFRAVSETESDYPFAAGASNLVGVYER